MFVFGKLGLKVNEEIILNFYGSIAIQTKYHTQSNATGEKPNQFSASFSPGILPFPQVSPTFLFWKKNVKKFNRAPRVERRIFWVNVRKLRTNAKLFQQPKILHKSTSYLSLLNVRQMQVNIQNSKIWGGPLLSTVIFRCTLVTLKVINSITRYYM